MYCRYSYEAVEFALKHIYSGCVDLPEGINLGEMATLSDMLELDGLKDMLSYSMTTKYCHSFHKVIPIDFDSCILVRCDTGTPISQKCGGWSRD